MITLQCITLDSDDDDGDGGDDNDNIAVHHTGGVDRHALLGSRRPGKPGDGQ